MFHVTPPDMWNILSNIQTSGNEALCVRNIIMEGSRNTESLSGFSGWISLLTCVEGVRHYTRHRKYTSDRVANSSADVNNVLHFLSSVSRPTNLLGLKKIVSQILIDKFSRNIVLDAYTLVGSDGQIFIHKDASSNSVIELINGYKFTCKVDPRFAAATKIEKWEAGTPKMYIIDGIVERVSEINNILEDASNKKYPGILMCLGYSEEVIATLSVNYLRGSLDIVPMTPGFGIENINMLKDLAVVVGSDVISSHKGELISSIDPDDIQCVEKVTVDRRGILIQNSPSKNWTLSHIRHLIERRDEETVDDKVNIINLRLASLTSRYCHIKLGEHLGESAGLILGRIETGIKMGREISRFGVISIPMAMKQLDKTDDLLLTTIVKNVLRRLHDTGFEEVSSSSLILGLRSGLSCCESITSTGYFLTSN